MEVISNIFIQISWYQLASTFFALIYIFFAVKNKSICFVFGLLSAIFWAYESYYLLNLKFDAGLQVFYILMSLYGIVVWMKGGPNKTEREISMFGARNHAFLIALGVGITIAVYYLSFDFFETSHRFLDVLTTVFSVLATGLLVYRILGNWIYWIIIDLLYIYIYYVQGGYLFSIIMLINTIMAVMGYNNWRKLYLDKV